MEENLYVVYIRMDEKNLVIDVNSSAFLFNIDNWIEIDRGCELRHYHAQGNYFQQSLRDDRGICRYKAGLCTDMSDDCKPIHVFERDDEVWAVYERTTEEMDADYAVLPAPTPTQVERITALEEELKAAKILLGLEE